MGTIRKRGDKWQAMVRRTGHAPISRTFSLKQDATRWVQSTELEIEREGLVEDRSCLKQIHLSDLLIRYRDTVSIAKRGHDDVERWVIGHILRQPMAGRRLSELRSDHVQEWVDQRLTEITARSLKRQLSVLSHVFVVARRNWKLPVGNPTRNLIIPASSPRRQRRLVAGEGALLHVELARTRNPYLLPILLIAKETSMRRGEIVNLKWADVGEDYLQIPISKNGESRTIAMSAKVKAVLLRVPQVDDRIFPVSASAVTQAWRRLVKRAGIEDLNFHDLRHEAISRFFELGLSAPEVQSMSGHRDMRMLYSYAHANRRAVLAKLNGGEASILDQLQ